MLNEKQSQAKNLYFQTDLTKTQIADLLNVSRRSLHYWVKDNNWDRLKKSATHLPAMLAENCYLIIGQFTQALLSENRIMRPVTHQEADTLHKLALTAKKLKNHSTLNESMEMFAHFMERVNKKSPELAEQISPFVDEYVESWAAISAGQFKPDMLNEQGFIPIEKEDPTEIQQDIADIMAWEMEQGNTPQADLHDIENHYAASAAHTQPADDALTADTADATAPAHKQNIATATDVLSVAAHPDSQVTKQDYTTPLSKRPRIMHRDPRRNAA